jgi:glycosyltransferase involved in cell wall biosynthesis
VVHLDIINMAQYHKWVRGIVSVHSANDATSMVYMQSARQASTLLKKIKFYASALLLRRFEKKVYKSFNKVHVVSQMDADYLKQLCASIEVEAIPIAVDDAYLRMWRRPRHESSAEFTIICTGNLANSAIANGVIDFMNRGLPLISRQWPEVRFVMLGQNANQAQLAAFDSSCGAQVLTWVDNYADFLALGDVFLVPDQFGPPGIKTRTLQAMGVGLPVVGTPTAFAGIPCVHGVHGMLYLTPEDAAKEICILFGDRGLRESVGLSAHRLVNDGFSIGVIGPQYEDMYRAVGASIVK